MTIPKAPALSAGMRLGSYAILSLIGAGRMAEVYRARDKRPPLFHNALTCYRGGTATLFSFPYKSIDRASSWSHWSRPRLSSGASM